MKIPFYQVDAFANAPFTGNPAAVCVLTDWLDDAVMQRIAAENNLSETAFVAREGEHWRLRWFTPTVEVELCGHATLATAAVLFETVEPEADRVFFKTRSGGLSVRRQGDLITLEFPAKPAQPASPPVILRQALNAVAVEVRKADNWLVVLDNEQQVRNLQPDFALLAELTDGGVIVTAKGDEPDVDFVSRYFAPNYGIDEDPVTGSAHCTLAPYWAEQLGKQKLQARQVSRRGGSLLCEVVKGDQVLISGTAIKVIEGHWLL